MCGLRSCGSHAALTFWRARRYFAGADLVSVFVAGAAVVVLELESEPPEVDESLDLPVDASVAEPEVAPPDVSVVEPVVEPVDELVDEPAEVADAAVLLEVALSVL